MMFTGGQITCAVCHNPIPANLIACPKCLEAKSRATVIEHQYQLLPRVLSTEFPFNVCNNGQRVHLVLFGIGLKAWCWVKLPSATRTRYTLPYSDADQKVTCTDCRRQMNSLVARYRAEQGL